MRWECGESFEAKIVRERSWHSWYAWHPVRLDSGTMCWLENVERTRPASDYRYVWYYRALGEQP